MKNFSTLLGSTIVALLVASVSNAAPIFLNDGIYYRQGECPYRLNNNIPQNSIEIFTVSTSDVTCVNSRNFQLTRHGEFVYSETAPYKYVYAEKDIQECAPQADNPQPCREFLYSQPGGSLLIKVGDVIMEWYTVDLINLNEFTLTDHYRLTRDGQVVTQGTDYSNIFAHPTQ